MKTTTANVLERMIWTAIAAGLAAVPITLVFTSSGPSVAGWSLLTAGVAAAIALVKNLLLTPPEFTRGFLGVVERFLWTGVQAFVASLPVTINFNGHDLKALGYSGLLAAVAAIVSLAKNITVVVPTQALASPLGTFRAPSSWPGAPMTPLEPDTAPMTGSRGVGARFVTLDAPVPKAAKKGRTKRPVH